MRIGIDLGGSKIEGVVLAANGAVSVKRRILTPRGDYDETLNAVSALVAELERAVGRRCSIGLATPGAISPATGRMQNCNSTCLNNRDFKADLQQRLSREVRMANDADCMALSEASDGAAAGVPSVFAVILGTGVGGSLVYNGQPLRGPNAIAGEWGHNALPWPQAAELPGRPCYCGLRGCIETFLSGPALEADYLATAGEALPAAEISRRSNVASREVLERYCHRLARALASVINVVDPNVIVLAGGVSNIAHLYERVPQLWAQWIFAEQPQTRLVAAKHGDSSGVRGAAWLWGVN